MKHPKTYTFREIEDKCELERIMKLRYQSYFNNSMQGFLSPKNNDIDIDIYDLHSRHFGLFCDNEPTGFIRIVNDKKETYNKHVFSIGKAYNIFNEKDHSKSGIKQIAYPNFPFVSYHGAPKSVRKYYNDLIENGDSLVEASRLMLIGKNKGIHIARFLTECAIVMYVLILDKQKYAVVNCNESHNRFYKQYGFEKVNSIEKYFIEENIDKPTCLMSLSLSLASIPEEHHFKFKEMANEFLRKKKITRKI